MSAKDLDLQWFAAEDEGRTEDATEHKLEEARKEGKVAKSQEIPGALVLLLPVITLVILAPWIFKNILEIIRFYFTQCGKADLEDPALAAVFFTYFLKIFIPIAVVGIVAALSGNLIQTRGFLFSTKPIQPKFSNIVPRFGKYFKKTLFSREGAFNVIKQILKVAIIFFLAFMIIRNDLTNILLLLKVNLYSGFKFVAKKAALLLIAAAVIFLIISIPDYVIQRMQFKEQMKMTKQEVKEEFKQLEGDPLVKSRLRQMMRQLLYQNLPKAVSEADVVITNPTHYAVAVKYDSNVNQAPMVNAKGADETAVRIKKLAKENNVEIVENKLLARELYTKVEIGDIIPEEYYQAMSIILAKVYSLKKNKR
ncbi:MAG: flagellar biosynthesis protein FlhB [Treponemataceae bacterium]